MGSIAESCIAALIMPDYVPDNNIYLSMAYIVYIGIFCTINAGIIVVNIPDRLAGFI